MNRELRARIVVFLLAIVLPVTACKKKKSEEPDALHRIGSSPVGTSRVVLHQVLTVRTSESFPFDIPSHAAMPHLHGNYKAYTGKRVIQSGEDTASVDFLVLTEEQYSDFVSGGETSALFTADASHEQTVDVGLPPSLSQPKKYYLLFRNPGGGNTKTVVQADLSVDF